MTHYHTFLIGNLTIRFKFGFSQTCIFVFFLKKKKLSGNSNFLKKKNHFFTIKIESCHQVGAHVKNTSPRLS